MEARSVFLPVCAQVLLTFLVWIWLYVTRLGALHRAKVDPQILADARKADLVLKDVVNPSDNFENLFEVPVLYYVAMIVVYVTGLADPTYLAAAWAYVGLRAVHSFIHCSYNRVVHRFTAYFLSSLVVWGIWARIGAQLLIP